jgi:hypothetical protein
MSGVGEDLQEVLRRGFAGLHPRHDAARNQVGWVQSQTVGGDILTVGEVCDSS